MIIFGDKSLTCTKFSLFCENRGFLGIEVVKASGFIELLRGSPFSTEEELLLQELYLQYEEDSEDEDFVQSLIREDDFRPGSSWSTCHRVFTPPLKAGQLYRIEWTYDFFTSSDDTLFCGNVFLDGSLVQEVRRSLATEEMSTVYGFRPFTSSTGLPLEIRLDVRQATPWGYSVVSRVCFWYEKKSLEV